MSFDDRAAIVEFVVESREHLADIERQFRRIEATGDNIDGELLSQAISAAHSIQEDAGCFGFATLQGLAIKLENLLSLVRDWQPEPPSAITGIFLRVAGRLGEMIEDIERSSPVGVSR
jgi:two-component system chemotaxis sensor kinase CheA